MKKSLLLLTVVLFTTAIHSQIDAFVIYGKKSEGVSPKFGFGGFLKISHYVNEDKDEVTVELAVLGLDGYSLGFVPMKAGYRYTFNRTGFGLYFEPQIGYAIGDDYDEKANGFVGSGNFGYLFQPMGGVRFDLALRFENIFTKIGTYNFAGIRLAHNLSFRRRND